MPNLLWFNVELEIQRLRKTGMLEWICHLRPSLHEECSENIPFTNTLRNTFVRRVPASLKNSMIAFLCRPDVTVGTKATQLVNLNAMGEKGYGGGRSHVAALNHQRQDGCDDHKGQQNPSSN